MSEAHSTEIWRDVPGFPGYQVSDLGRVRTSRPPRGVKAMTGWRILEPYRLPKGKGYLFVILNRDGQGWQRYVHRLVLEAFVGACPPDMECRHVNDPDPQNNRLENLAWGTKRENAADALRHGTRVMGARASAAKLSDEGVAALLADAAAGARICDLARRYNLRRENVSKIVNGHHWRHVAGPRKARPSIPPGHVKTAEAAARLGVTVARVQQLVKEGVLLATRYSRGLLIEEGSVEGAAGRPRCWKRAAATDAARRLG